jgi:PPOX class probable F420-dependent enzyme
MASIDFESDFGKRVLGQLESEQVAWLTTVSPSGQPQPSPVWFLWRDGTILIFSEPTAPKVRNIGQNAKVSVAFNTDFHGNEVSILQGEARLEADQMTGEDAASFTDYVEKYQGGIDSLSLTPESMLNQYSQLIVITPTRLRGW